MVGANAHFANGLAAVYIACGQDVAHIVNASVGINMLEMTESGDLYAAVKLPNILVGTVGGGTALGTQQECLRVLGCYGEGKSKKFAEIIAATLLAGEIGICAGITSDEFLEPHKRARVFTREKAFQQKETQG
jgi:hydroxymethylglutaryl-CoA reductase (NADPH)